jgi:hypothetical protein
MQPKSAGSCHLSGPWLLETAGIRSVDRWIQPPLRAKEFSIMDLLKPIALVTGASDVLNVRVLGWFALNQDSVHSLSFERGPNVNWG